MRSRSPVVRKPSSTCKAKRECTTSPPWTDPERMAARLITVDLAVQALIERLLLAGTLDPSDLLAMRELGVQLAAELKEPFQVEQEVRSFWSVFGQSRPR